MVFAATGMPKSGTQCTERRANEVIGGWAQRRPDAVALRVIQSTGVQESRIDVWTYRRLWERVSQIRDGAFADLESGSRVVMAQAGDADYVAGFIAALEAGLVPVPLYLPAADAPERFLQRAQHILRDCSPAAVYTSAELVDALDGAPLLDGLALRTPDSVVEADRPSLATHGTVAFLQYSSGSTGDPKGIVNTHESMLHQLAIARALWNRPDDIHTVSWLPLYHDLGMFWGMLLALGTGGSATLIPPFDFVRNPRIWLETVDAVRGNWIAGPDFGYRLCVDAFGDVSGKASSEALAHLDLSCLRLATSGAEPVRASTLRDFVAKFEPAGLRADIMAPQYGLAEAGLAVSGTDRPRRWVQADFDAEQLNRGRAVEVSELAGAASSGRRIHTLVSCGNNTFGWDVRIVDPDRRNVVSDGNVGEIWVGGSGLPQGYWGRPQESADIFGARTADGSGPYLRTGDAGFRSGSELFICGRYRDLIIVGGGNYFPNDIESTVEEAQCGVQAGGACAVQSDASQEWCLVLEVADATSSTSDDLEDISRVLRRRILAAHQIAPERIVWVRPRVLPRTTSGKIRRRKTLEMLGTGAFDIVHQVGPTPRGAEAALTDLAEYVAGLLGVRSLASTADLTMLGLTSMMTAQVVEWAATRGRHLDFAALYAEPALGNWQRLFDGAPTPQHPEFVGDTFPTSALQRAYWVGRGAEQPLGGVGCQTYFELSGPVLDSDRLDQALTALAQRHPMLRSKFPDVDRLRVVPDTIHPPLRVHDLTETAGLSRHLEEVRDRLRTHRFAIETGDTWRVELTRLPDSCVLHFAVDLIVADLTSIGILLRDLAALYRGDELPVLAIGFGEVVRSKPIAEASDRLPEGPQLPQVEEREISFGRRQHTLNADAVEALDAQCRAHGITRAAAFLATYSLVLRHWSNADEFLVNVTTFGRPPGVPDVVGDFTRTHLLVASVDEAAGFAEQAAGTQRGLRAALSAPESTEQLAAQMRTGTGHSGIAPVVFTYAADTAILAPGDARTLGAVGEIASMTPQVIIDSQVGAVGDDLIVSWDYRAGCFPSGVVADMFAAYVGLLESLGAHDWSRPATIELPRHSRLARRQRNTTDAPRPQGLLYDAFRDLSRLDPERVALRWGTGEFEGESSGDPIAYLYPRVTYGVLDEHARSVAGALAHRHAPGEVIGIQLPKGPGQIVATLGVLMAGCSYLPVGLDQPADRLDRICSLSQMAGLIRSQHLQHKEVATTVHHIESMIRCAPVQPARVGPQDAAYVIYTSGSTGEPKGVVVSHAAALNTIVDVNRRNGVADADAVLALSALDFDLSVYDIFGPLSAGASVVTIAEKSRRDAFRWCALIAEHAVTVWNSVPALMEMLLIAAGENSAALASLRSVLLSGDWIPLDMPRRLRRVAPQARLVAMGGATEASIWSNEFVLPATVDVEPEWVSVPYGYPLSNQAFRVVDERGRDRPDYVAGELWIGGAGVADGYHNAPELTAERFVRDAAGQRWYRTGDLGCYWSDGTLQFLGRVDSQVKVGGHRVECGEIEFILRGHPLVDSATVVPMQGNTALGAVVVGACSAAEAIDTAPEKLRAYLSDRLPQYMIPRWYLFRAEPPLNANGKIDRRRAAAEVEALARIGTGRRSATGLRPVQQLVADVWSEVLGTPITRGSDNFFAHGGDSLRATQVCAALKRKGVLGAEVSQLLGRQTLAEFASACVVGEPEPEVADQSPAASAAEFALTRLQQAYVLGSSGLSGRTCAPTYFAIVLAAQAPASGIDLERFAAAVAGCVDEFALLRCALDSDAGQRVRAEVATGALTLVDGADADALMRHMAAAPFDARTVPVIACFALSGSSRYVGLLINYLSLDARSLATVIATIVADYQRVPRPRPVDPTADVFARFVSEAGGDDNAVRYRVSGPPALPGEQPGAAVRVAFDRSGFTLDAAAFAGLRDRAAQWRVTPTALIFEAFAHALHAVGAGERFAIVVPTSHRPDYAPAGREVLGNFTRLALCDSDYRHNAPGSQEAVAAAQRQLWQAIDGGDATGHVAALRTTAGYPVVFTSTLGLFPHQDGELLNTSTLTQTPGVWLDCQVEDVMGGARISWDTATGVLEDHLLAEAFSRFERAVRHHAGQPDEPAVPVMPNLPLIERDWASAVIAEAATLCDIRTVRPEYAELVQRWRQSPNISAATHDTARAAHRLADIVTGAASPQTLIGDPQLAPEALLLADERLQVALDDLAGRIFTHSRRLGRRVRVAEVGSRSGLITERIAGLTGAVIDEYLCLEPNLVLAEIAAGRSVPTGARPISSAAEAAGVDVVLCCGSLHQMHDVDALLDALVVADDGWLWVAEICEVTSATLASAAVLNPGLLSAGLLRTADQWWRLIADHGWQPTQMAQDGPGITVIAQSSRSRPRQRPMPRTPMAPPPTATPIADESVLAAIAEIWQRHLDLAEPNPPAATDDFFLLGGDSLVATRVYADLRAAGFGKLALVDLFNYPVLGELAAFAGEPGPPQSAQAPVTVGVDPGAEFPLTVVQQAYLAGRVGGFLLSGVAAHCYFEFVTTDFDRWRFETAARQLVEHHPGLRTTVAPAADGGQSPRSARSARSVRFKGVVHAAPIEPIVTEYHSDSNAVRARMRDQVIDVTTRPGIDFGIQQLDGRTIVGVSMDNIMLDGTSMMIALAQLDHLYRGGSIDELPASTTTFGDYVRCRPELWPDADESTLPRLAVSRDYWRARLPSLPPAPQLSPIQTILDIEKPSFQRVEAVVAEVDWTQIRQQCRAQRVTPSAFLLACYARALAQWAATPHFCINVTLFDRDPDVAGIEHAIGDFTSLLLLECHVDAAGPIWDQARRLQQQLMTDLAHRAADAVWLQRELLRYHGRPAAAVYPVVFTSGLGLVDASAGSPFDLGAMEFGVSQTPQTVLDFQMWERAGSLALSWDFVTQAISPETARHNLDMMVAGMIATPAAAPPHTSDGEFAARVGGICAAALGLPRVALSDNFFQLGGDSVTATRVVEQLGREVSPSATLRLLFENPVIGDFAAKLGSLEADPPDGFEEGVL